MTVAVGMNSTAICLKSALLFLYWIRCYQRLFSPSVCVCLGVYGGSFLKLVLCFCYVVNFNLTELSKIFHSSNEILIGRLGTISLLFHGLP